MRGACGYIDLKLGVHQTKFISYCGYDTKIYKKISGILIYSVPHNLNIEFVSKKERKKFTRGKTKMAVHMTIPGQVVHSRKREDL